MTEDEPEPQGDFSAKARRAMSHGRAVADRAIDSIGRYAEDAKERLEDRRHPQPRDLETAEPSEFAEVADALGDRQFPVAVTIGAVLVAGVIAASTQDEDRRHKMERVIARHREVVAASAGLDGPDDAQLGALLVAISKGWDRGDRVRYLIELDFGDPFSPYSLKHSTQERRRGVSSVAILIGSSARQVKEIDETIREAAKAHQRLSLGRIALYGAGAAAAVGLLGFLAAPAFGAALGGAAGLTGAAATAHGLALLGGGTIAAGGAGMAGGMWLVTGAGATVGLISASGGTALYQLGVSQAQAELVKLQVTFKLTVLDAQISTIKAQQVIGGLQQQEDELRRRLAEERRLNDDNSSRVKDLEAKLTAIEASLGWMKDEANAA